ncbi:MAG: hypothetical protein ACI9DK_002071 [Vicingaceae bacterium]|jgi:hypothetical protein
MIRRVLLLFVFFYFALGDIRSQDTIPKQYLNDLPSYHRDYLKHDIPENLIESYANQNAYAKFNLTFYHKVYYNQPLLENYIRSILKKLVPENKEIGELEIYITKSTEFNAFTIGDGSIFVNIAALAQMTSEAEFAFLLAHEYGHYMLKHVERSYKKKNETKKKNKNPSIKEIEEYNSFSQSNEIASDSLGILLGTAAGYDARAMEQLIQKLIFLQKRQILRFNESYNSHMVFPTSHPAGEDRLLNIKLLRPLNDRGSLFILGQEQFDKVKRLAEYEFLKLLDEDFDLHQAISFPLKKYLLTGNDIYLPTLTRSIRKLMLLMPDIGDKGFMITHFSNYEERFAKKENILHHLHYEYPDSNEIAKMKTKGAINFKKVPFYTYEDAFDFFTKKSTASGYAEPYLDVALYYGIKSPKGRAGLNKYLSNSDNLYHEYALLLKKNKLLEGMEGKDKVILLGGLPYYEFKKGKINIDRVDQHENRNSLLSLVRNKYLEDSLHYKIYNYIDFYQESPLSPHLRTIEKLVYSGNSKVMLQYDPRLYYAFKKSNINSLEYMSIQHLKYKRPYGRLLIGMIPPLTIFTVYNLLTQNPSYYKHINVYNYYACFVYKDEFLGKSFSDVEGGGMNEKKSTKKLYKLHRTQKSFFRQTGFFIKIKDRTEWRY